MLLLALLLAVLPNERPAYRVADFVDVAVDCPVRYYAGRSEPICDIAPAVQAAELACEATAPRGWAGDNGLGCTVELDRGLYCWGSTVSVCGSFSLDLGKSKIFVAPDVTPIVFTGFQACRDDGRPDPGISSLERAWLTPWSTNTSTAVVTRGVEMHAPAKLRDLRIIGFVQGIYIVANATATDVHSRANANGWGMQDIGVQSSLHAGIWVDGPDVNVGLGLRVGSTGNCKKGTNYVPSLGPCADIMDGSFLGCSWVAASSGYAKDTVTAEVFPGIVLGDSANSRSTCTGCYIESGYGGGIAAATTNVLGGIGGWTGSGNRLEGNRISGLRSTGSDGTMEIKLGSLTGGGALSLVPLGVSGSYPLRFKFVSDYFLLDVGNVAYAQVLRIGGKASSVGGLGGLMLRPGTAPVYLNSAGKILASEVAP